MNLDQGGRTTSFDINSILAQLGPVGAIVAGLFVVLLIIWFLRTFIRVIQEYERAVVFRLGTVTRRPRGPGLILLIPLIERAQKVDIRTVTLGIQPQDCITADNVTVRVDAVAYFKVTDPIKAMVNVRDYIQATLQIAQTSLRSVVGQVELDTLLAHRDEINRRLGEIIDKHTVAWGIDVGVVEVKDIQLPDQMVRAMAKQAEAEREKRAKMIHAQGEFDAAERLQAAAATIAKEPAALQLRYLQTLAEISIEKNSTIVLYDTANLHVAINRLLGVMDSKNANVMNLTQPPNGQQVQQPPPHDTRTRQVGGD
jgi:regulator of protease activity HflC (stomatin/prohibitin superfamily)